MSRRTPQYVRCSLCTHMWVGYWLPMAMNTGARIMECAHCPVCAADSSYIERQNTPVVPENDPSGSNVQVTFSTTADSDIAADIRLLLGRVQLGDPLSACKHPRSIRYLLEHAKQIDNAAAYQRSVDKQAGVA